MNLDCRKEIKMVSRVSLFIRREEVVQLHGVGGKVGNEEVGSHT
jgi:hypothetical protein